ncbi:MAG TPA: LpqB family beta-propeller domain-containing protein [Gaiellaceae bacterium]|nr:LpqB family beta-propeller domain-containing protein [Gaiellaceae bacterium]
MRRVASLGGLALCAALVLSGCGGGSKARPDLLFVSTKGGVYDVYEMNADGSDQSRLSSGSSGNATTEQGLFHARDPAYSKDGKHIAFVSARTGSLDVYVMDANGKNVRQISSTASEDSHPSWSPDGKRIVFVRGKVGAIFVMNADGSGVKRVTHGTTEESDPAWSPDGKWIAFVRLTAGTPVREVWLVHPDGTGAKMLTSLAASVNGPAWSPDGKQIAFSSDARGGHFAIYTIDVSGLGLRLVSGGSVDSYSPAWSPDGKQIAFSRNGSIVIATIGGGEKAVTKPQDNDTTPVWNPIPAPAKKKSSSGY